MGLIIRSSAIHAAGCYTTTPIRKGQRVAEYTGHRLTKAEADATYEESPITYLFGLGDGTIVIDGHSTAMFINHSCDANCETSEEDGHVWIMAIRDIPAGEEITYDYCLYDGGDDEARLQLRRRAVPGHHVFPPGDQASQGSGKKSVGERTGQASRHESASVSTAHSLLS